jgi:hypothetical protein
MQTTQPRKAVKTMRERLIELLENSPMLDVLDGDYGKAADHLLENGVVVVDTNTISIENRPLVSTIANYPIDEVVGFMKAREEGRIIVLPCKVGSRIYRIVPDGSVIYPDPPEYMVIWDVFKLQDINNFGKTVFLTKEEAEKALKGVQG